MNGVLKNTMKFMFGICAALSVVTIGAVVAGGTAVRVIAEGFKAGTDAMKKTLAEIQAESGKETSSEEVTPADFADETATDAEN